MLIKGESQANVHGESSDDDKSNDIELRTEVAHQILHWIAAWYSLGFFLTAGRQASMLNECFEKKKLLPAR